MRETHVVELVEPLRNARVRARAALPARRPVRPVGRMAMGWQRAGFNCRSGKDFAVAYGNRTDAGHPAGDAGRVVPCASSRPRYDSLGGGGAYLDPDAAAGAGAIVVARVWSADAARRMAFARRDSDQQ